MLYHKASLNKFKRIEVISGIFSDHNGMKLKINYTENWKIYKYVEIKQHAAEKPMGQKRNQKIPGDKLKLKCNILNFMGCSKSSLREKSILINAYLKK